MFQAHSIIESFPSVNKKVVGHAKCEKNLHIKIIRSTNGVYTQLMENDHDGRVEKRLKRKNDWNNG